VNGELYGLYANIEKIDKEFLQRLWDDDDEGPLYKYGSVPSANEEDVNEARLDEWLYGDLTAIDGVADLEQAVAGWAAEAILPQGDGYFGGRGNFYMYDHPARGFVFIPWDLDSAFDWVREPRLDPILYIADEEVKYPQFAAVVADPTWRTAYVDAVEAALEKLDVAVLQARVDEWSAQIADAASADPNKQFTFERHQEKVASLRSWLDLRAAFVREWLDCQRGVAGATADADADGIRWCDDCDETGCTDAQ
jgi:hypothetical protein